jgi:F5/8 type C domain
MNHDAAQIISTNFRAQLLNRFNSTFLLLVLAVSSYGQHVTVEISPEKATNSISPVHAMGAGIDRDPLNSVKTIFHSPDLEQMLSAGWGSVSYRLNTELGVSSWHWNPRGIWNDPEKQGYFVGAADSPGKIERSFGYFLPHNGMSSSFLGYGVLDDGSLDTYWKSNPYLSEHFTHESDSLHEQWVVVDLGSISPVDAIKIAWTDPYAVNYEVQYWTGSDAINDPAHGRWKTFSGGAVTNGAGGTVLLELAERPVNAEFVRISMTVSSGTCDSHGSSDIRNCLGFAIRELYVGHLDSTGKFVDLVHHRADGSQTQIYTSSTDSWHRPSDIDPFDGEQPGFDLVYGSGITRGLPMTVPVAMLYDNPANAANEIAYLEAHGFPIRYVELGEEPDGQWVLPEDDAALYVQWADAIHAVDPNIKLAGPVFQGVNSDIPAWPDARGNTSWFTRFLNYLRSHNHLHDLNVMTFEHYPFDPCSLQWQALYSEPALVRGIMKVWREDGLPASVPMHITESNLSWNADTNYMQTFAALWLADYLGSFFTAGGQAAYYYQYEPLPMYNGCGWGTFGMFNVDSQYTIKQYVSQYFAAQMLTQEWAEPIDLMHFVYPASADIADRAGNALVTAYALQRPDGLWSLLLVNRDELNAHDVSVTFHSHADHYFDGAVAQVSFGSDEYGWHANGPHGYANPDGPAVYSTQEGGRGAVYSLPKASITVLRGEVD